MTLQDRVYSHLKNKLHSDIGRSELRSIANGGYDWFLRADETIDILVPRLIPMAERLAVEVPAKLNSSKELISLVNAGQQRFENLPEVASWIAEIRSVATNASELIGHLESQQVSAAVQRYISSEDGIGDLVFSNGGSIYPDFILGTRTYDRLPFQSHKEAVAGPCLQGKAKPRPSNVPDGLELKTNKGKRIRVDAHGAHAGLHLGVTWDLVDGRVEINGVWIGYIRFSDHRESGRNVAVTTVKHSFGHEHFTSLLG